MNILVISKPKLKYTYKIFLNHQHIVKQTNFYSKTTFNENAEYRYPIQKSGTRPPSNIKATKSRNDGNKNTQADPRVILWIPLLSLSRSSCYDWR